jgi:hypothetical protein
MAGSGEAWPGPLRRGTFWPGGRGNSCRVMLRYCLFWRSWCGPVWSGEARSGEAWCVMAVMVRRGVACSVETRLGPVG